MSVRIAGDSVVMKLESVLVGFGVVVAGIIILSKKSSASTDTASFYKNDEKWEICRNADGYIQNINIKRDAKTG